MAFKDFFFNAYIEFQKETRKSGITAFAKYLSVKNGFGVTFSQQIVSGWLNGDYEPSEKYAPALAYVLGDGIYDILNLPRPDPDLQFINRLWPELTDEDRRIIVEQAKKFRLANERKLSKPKTIPGTT